jgi:uncharacterized damage-inducible protein DinB
MPDSILTGMLTTDGLTTAYTRNANYVQTYLNGLTHADAIVQPPVEGNCIQWILGHIVCYRNYILNVLGQSPILPEAARYAKDSAPVTGNEPENPSFETLLNAYFQAQEIILGCIRTLTPEAAAEVVTQGDFTMPRGDLLVSYMRHESYHAGQFELLRQIALHARGQGK